MTDTTPLVSADASSRCSIILVNWNTRQHVLAALINTSQPARPRRDWMVVVDNHSTDGSRQALEEYRRSQPERFVRYVLNDENRGYAAAVNQGIRETRTPYVLVANADVELDRAGDVVDSLVRFLDEHPQAAIVGPRLLHADGSLQLSWGREPHFLTEALQRCWWRRVERAGCLRRFAKHPRTVDWVLGACFLLRRHAFDQIGGMNERYHMYFEEIDLCSRLRRAGWGIWYLPTTPPVIHHGGASTRQIPDAMAIAYRRSQLRFYHTFHGPVAAGLLRAYLTVKFVGTARGRRVLQALNASAA